MQLSIFNIEVMKHKNYEITSIISEPLSTVICQLPTVSYAFFWAFAFSATGFGLAGLELPKDPLKIFPFFVFLSPLPIIVFCLQMSVK